MYDQDGTATGKSGDGKRKIKHRDVTEKFEGTDAELVAAGIAAAKIGQIELIDEYLNCGINPDTLDDNKMSMLMWAAGKGHAEIVKLLVEGGGAEVDFRPVKESLTALFWAVKYGQLKSVKELIRLGANVNQRDARRHTPLMYAVANGNAAITFLLLENGANPTALAHVEESNEKRIKCPYCPTILEEWNQLKIHLLQECDGHRGRRSINQQTWTDIRNHNKTQEETVSVKKNDFQLGENVEWEELNEGIFPLQLAALYDQHLLIPLLEFNANINQLDNKGRSALHWAASYGNMKALFVLTEYDEEIDVNIREDAGNDALMWAIRNGHVEATQFLRQKTGSNGQSPRLANN